MSSGRRLTDSRQHYSEVDESPTSCRFESGTVSPETNTTFYLKLSSISWTDMDEALFDCCNRHEYIWLPHDEDSKRPLEYDSQSQNNAECDKQSPLTTLWMCSGKEFTSQYYIDTGLPEICALHDAKDRRRVVTHTGNTTPHVSKRTSS
jgi:hypothetical protein